MTALIAIIVSAKPALAHCPLCTIGAGLVAGGAAWLGVKYAVIGIFLGAFSFALGFWISTMIKKKYIPYQNWVLGLISFLTTILPLRPLLEDYGSLFISLSGDYGSLLNRTYLIDKFFVGSLAGAIILMISPYISKALTKSRKGKMLWSYQGMAITFALLIFAGLITQFFL